MLGGRGEEVVREDAALSRADEWRNTSTNPMLATQT